MNNGALRALAPLGLLLALLLALVACAPPPAPPPAPARGAPADFPSQTYRRAAAQAKPVYRVDTRDSRILIYVYRGGILARMGHDHVVASHDVHGYAVFPADGSGVRADLYFPVSTLSVDEAALRADAGLETTPSAEDIQGTRRHMLHSVLEAQEYPYVRLRVTRITGRPPDVLVSCELTLHGQTHALEVPARVNRNGPRLSATGELTIRQTDFGITPYSVLGGALAVKDEIRIRFELRGEPATDADFSS